MRAARRFRFYELSNHLGNVLVTMTGKKKGVGTSADNVVDYYVAEMMMAQDYYPFGMLMPGRRSDAGDYRFLVTDSAGEGEQVLADLTVDSRTGNVPREYEATNSITLDPDFESGVSDEFLAHIVADAGDPSDVAPGSYYSGSEGRYRYGFNGKENDNEIKGEGNQQDYGMRMYDPRLGRFLSVDPLTQKFPFYTPYQFAGNKPIWALDVDGQEDVYYTVNVVINGLGQAKLRSITENETKAVHWWNENKTGNLGSGKLFTYRIETQEMDGKPISLITKSVFVPKPTFTESVNSGHVDPPFWDVDPPCLQAL